MPVFNLDGTVIRRRNSILSVGNEPDGRRAVYKRYIGTYDARQEAKAYADLASLTEGLDYVHHATLIRVDEAANEVVVEHVPGETLEVTLWREGLPPAIEQELACLLAATRRRGMHFDTDPSNMILSGNRLVLVDPTVQGLPLLNLSAVIFMHGLLKLAGRHPAGACGIASFALRLLFRYCGEAGVQQREVEREWARYLLQVIVWNLTRSPGEPGWMLPLRAVLLVPCYALAAIVLRLKAALPRWSAR